MIHKPWLVHYQHRSTMVIYGVYIVSKSGGLIFNHDHNVPKIENERQFLYPLDIKLNYENKKIVVSFGQRDGIMGKKFEFNFIFHVVLYFIRYSVVRKCNLIINNTKQIGKQFITVVDVSLLRNHKRSTSHRLDFHFSWSCFNVS